MLAEVETGAALNIAAPQLWIVALLKCAFYFWLHNFSCFFHPLTKSPSKSSAQTSQLRWT